MVYTRFRFIRLLPAIALFLALAGSVQGQYYFGKNKVQYTHFNWRVMTTDHFRIYFYDQETHVAGIAAFLAEEAYREMAQRFNHEVPKPIPLIIYSAPAFFWQTNTTPGLLPESVGGFTEFMKGRVVVPFHGSYADFAHVIRHEMVHAVMISKFEETLNRQARVRYDYPPLWLTEGLAECWSTEWDTEADMIVKDLVLAGRIPTIEQLYLYNGSYFIYKLGESLCRFIESEYGPEKLSLLFDNWYKGSRFDQVVELTLGDPIAEVSRKWHYALKKKYFPQIGESGLPKMESRQITRSGFAVRGVPIRWRDGEQEKDWIIYKANRLGYTGIYARPIEGGKERTLLKGERSPRFESLYLLRSGIDATNDGLVVFASKSSERDAIYVYDLEQDRIRHESRFDNLIAAQSPRFSPDGSHIVFTGVKEGGFADLYTITLSSGQLTQITDDVFYDTDAAFTRDNLAIVFSSDRGEFGDRHGRNIYRVELGSHEVSQLTFGHSIDQSPDPTDRGIFFTSDREGSYNIYCLKPDGSLERYSTLVTGAFDPRLSSDGSYLTYTGYQDMAFHVYRLDPPETPAPVQHERILAQAGWEPQSIDRSVSEGSVRYDADYSFDIAQSAIAYDPIFGSVGGVQAAMSDMLGNKAYYFLLSNTAETSSDILSSFNAGITFVNRERRLNWGVGLFHLYDEYYNAYELYYDERQAGALAFVSYPLSKFQRVDFSTYARYSKKDRSFGFKDREAFLLGHYLSVVYDNSIWDVSGPIEGRRYNFTIGLTNSLSDERAFNRVGFADVRHYFRLGTYSAFANRLFAYSSAGLEPQRTYFGGSWSFRGFDRRQWYARNVLFASNELRFPLIDDLVIGLPIGDLGFSGIRGALFFDAGSAWDDTFDQLYGSFGAGVRISLGYLVLLRLDFARTTDFETISNNTDVDFFFGWNF